LLPADVFCYKVPKPAKEIGIAIVEIGIVFRTYMLMVLIVFRAENFIGIEDEKGGTNFPDGMIEFGIFRGYCPMHGIMSRNKEASEKMHLNQHPQQSPSTQDLSIHQEIEGQHPTP